LAEKSRRERSDANPYGEVDEHHILQEIDKDLGDIKWIVLYEIVKKQLIESIATQSLLTAQKMECAENFLTVTKGIRFLLNENKRLRRSTGMYDMYDPEIYAIHAELEKMVTEEPYEGYDEDEDKHLFD
jgi:hypothetical protein